MPTPERNCGRCHFCLEPVRLVLDGEEWCPRCERYQRPASHGWGRTKYSANPERLACNALDGSTVLLPGTRS